MTAVVYINLPNAQARRAFMETQGEKLGLRLDRLEAVAVGDIGADATAHLAGRWERPLTEAELACFLSHRSLWSRVASGGRPLLILEDDVVLSRRLPALLPALMAFDKADLINLEDFGRRRFVAKDAASVTEGLSVRRTFRDKAGAAAYILWPSGAERLLARAEFGAAPADAFLHAAVRLRAFQAEPALAIQAQFMAARGLASPLETTTQIQAPRERLPLTGPNLPFLARRLRTQATLAGEHLRRLGPAVFRRVDIDPGDF